MENFTAMFGFKQSGALLVGIERECFISDGKNVIMPRAAEILEYLPDRTKFGYELSACQLEDRVGPVEIGNLECGLQQNERELKAAEEKLNFRRLHLEIAPDDMPLDVYPDPTGRYQKIVKNMPRRVLLAACQITGTHIHIGMPDHQTALSVYNRVIGHAGRLCRLGDGSGGKRLEVYRIMVPDFEPLPYDSWRSFHLAALKSGFAQDPRKCWHLIRISVHGTIEFRMFGSTSDIGRIVGWAEICLRLCQDAMKA